MIPATILAVIDPLLTLPGGIEMGWRELSGVGVSCLVIFLSYALKESLSTKEHVHITRQERPDDAPSGSGA